MNSIPIPLPPLAEQRRIVARIEQLMARCDELEALRAQREHKRGQVQSAILREITADTDPATFRQNWQFLADHFGELHATPQNVAELRSAVLQLAVMGKLVPQDPAEGTARELLAEIEGEKRRLVAAGKIRAPKPLPPVGEAEQPYQVPEGWVWVRAGRITQLITSGSRDWSQYLAASGAIFVTMGNLSRGNYKLRLEKIRYVNPPKNAEGARTILEKDDLIISITGDVGNLGLIPDEFGEAYINQHSCIFRVLPFLRNKYYAEYMRSPVAKEQFDGPQRGIKNSFRLTDVEEMLFPLPPLAEQRRIVAKIDQLMDLCDVLEARLTKRTAKQGELLRAVMAELAPTLPAGQPATPSRGRAQAPGSADAPRGRGRPRKTAPEGAEAAAQPVTERRGRGRPRKDGSSLARSIPEAASMEDAIRRLEAMKRNKGRGMNGLFEE